MSIFLDDRQTRHLKSIVPVLAEEYIYINGSPLELERPWQYELVGSTNEYDVWGKARQIGYSFGTAGVRSTIRAHLFPPGSYNAVMVSINREEAREKIKYVESIWNNLSKDVRRGMKTCNKLEIEFDNGNTVRSFPSRAVRGIPNVDLLLDEFAHIKDAVAVYTGSTASTIRQSYGTTIGSTPYGRGLFKRIFQGAGLKGDYVHFKVHEVPWWMSRVLCKNVEYAVAFAPEMTTEERVRAFGTERLIREMESQTLESFQTEFEVAFFDYVNSVLTPELIASCSNGDMPCGILDFDFTESAIQPIALIKERIRGIVYELKESSAPALTRMFAGVDIGREVHATEIVIGDYNASRLSTRFYVTLRKCPFSDQDGVLSYLLDNLPIEKMVIDAQGIGKDLSERMMMKYSTRVVPMNFVESTKTDMVNAITRGFTETLVEIYPTRRIDQQLLDVRKIVSQNGRILYKSSSSKEEASIGEYRTHADLFWAMAMMVYGALLSEKSIIRVTRRPPVLRGFGMVSGWSGAPIRLNMGGSGGRYGR